MPTKKRKPDYILLLVVFFIILLGLFVLASASSVSSQQLSGYFLFQQLLYGFLPGLILAFIAYKIPLTAVQKWASLVLFINLFLLGLIFIPPFGETIRGATRWISIGPLSFQPAELLKLTFILYLASWLTARSKTTKRKKTLSLGNTFLPFLIVSIVIGGMFFLQSDLSTFIVIFFTALIVYFMAKTPVWHSGVFIIGSIAAFIVFIQFSSYRIQRIYGMLNPDLDPLGITYQIKQALIAVGSGGLAGIGLGMSQQKHGFLPFPMTDSIFAIFAEELGFIGSVALITLFLILFWRGFLIAKNSKDQFIKLIATGIISWIFIQFFIHIGAMTGIVPLTGIPLPFISYGKSHLIVEMIAIGVLLNASTYGKK